MGCFVLFVSADQHKMVCINVKFFQHPLPA